MCKAINLALINNKNAAEFKAKRQELDPVEVEVRGTRKPANRGERRKATAKAKNRRKNNESLKDMHIKKAEAGVGKYVMDYDYAYRITDLGGECYLDENRVFHPRRFISQVTRVDKPMKHHGKTDARVRRDGKNLPEERRDYFADGARAFEKDDKAFDFDNWFFEYENGETWEQMLARRNFNAESAWNWQLSMMRARGFYDAKELVRLNHEVEVINQKKQALLEEYAEKMECLNKHLRHRLDKIAVLKGEEPMFGF